MNELIAKFKALKAPAKAGVIAAPILLVSCLCCCPVSIIGYMNIGRNGPVPTLNAAELADDWRTHQGQQVILADTPYDRVDNKLMFYRESKGRLKVWATGDIGTAAKEQPIKLQGRVEGPSDGFLVVSLKDCKVLK